MRWFVRAAWNLHPLAVRGHRPRLQSHTTTLLWLAILSATAQAADYDLQLAREEATITTTADRTYHGLLDGMRDGRVYIRRATEGGEVGYSFTPEEIRELVIPGAELARDAIELGERGEIANALPRLEALGRQRFRYLPVLSREQRRPLLALIDAQIAAGDPRAAIAYVGLLRPYARDEREAAIVRDAELTAYAQLGLNAETRALAEAWCATADATEGSALGWRILAQLEYDAEDYDRALWIALQPIVFSTYLPLDELDACYALAIASAGQLGDRTTAARLLREMSDRNLALPDDPRFDGLALRYAANPSGEATSWAAPPAPTAALEARPAPFTLDDVRKGIHQE